MMYHSTAVIFVVFLHEHKFESMFESLKENSLHRSPPHP